MPFDYNKFEAASTTFPTKDIPVPTLTAFFPEGEKPVWKIKCMSGLEQAIVEDAVANNFLEKRKAVVDACVGDSIEKMKEGYQALLGTGENIAPDVYVRWLKLVEYGSVPRCPEHICVKLAHAQGGVLRRLAHEISIISAMGAEMGK